MAWFRTSIRMGLTAFIPSTRQPLETAATPPTESATATRREEIRLEMGRLARTCSGSRVEPLAVRIAYAADLQALWFLRSELMSLLAHAHGEAWARARLDALSAMFEGFLPAGLCQRPSRLGRS